MKIRRNMIFLEISTVGNIIFHENWKVGKVNFLSISKIWKYDIFIVFDSVGLRSLNKHLLLDYPLSWIHGKRIK